MAKRLGGKMAPRVRISCINKVPRHDPYDRIDFVGGENSDGTRWKMSQKNAIKAIEDGKYDFYVSGYGGQVDVIVSTSPNGNKYLKTRADGQLPNNLLSLPECPKLT